MREFDTVIIGAGPGGYVAAISASRAGQSVAVIENRRVGGTCLNRGCIPAKAMIHASTLYREALDGARFGVHAPDVTYNYEEIVQYKEDTIDKLVGGVEQLLKAGGVTLIQGTGTLELPQDGKNIVSVSAPEGEKELLSADHVILATGSKPAALPIPGADLPGVLNSDGLFALRQAPESLVIIGGGVIGVEFATAFANLGTKVTIVEALPKLLDNFDREISQNLKMILKKKGVDAHLNARVMEFVEGEEGVICRFSEKDKEQTVSGQYVLVAAGRRPVTEGLFGEGIRLVQEDEAEADSATESAVILMKGRFVQVDACQRTSMPGVYAIGDITGGMQLAHAASAQGIRAVEAIQKGCSDPAVCDCDPADSCCDPSSFSQDIPVIPGGVYTDPEIASVGMTEAEAKEAGREVLCGKFIMSANGKSLITGDERGFIKVVADASTDEILGAQMMCSRATDMIGEFTTAIVNHMTVADMLRSVRPHPTYNEGIAEALEAVHGTSLHTVPQRRR